MFLFQSVHGFRVWKHRRLASRVVAMSADPTRERPMRDASGPVEHARLRSARNWFPVRPRRRKDSLCMRVSDPQTDVAPSNTRGRDVRSKNQCSMCPAIHTKSRSWLRSSSTREPSDPLLRVVFFVFFEARGSLPSPVAFESSRSRLSRGGEKLSRLESSGLARAALSRTADASRIGARPRES